ncbi:MAG TPA: hypothetical protein VLF39_00015 [Candidatus Saccharimonadales bacterium]|nr:hypothetical protein [Candidatus Saccharimonadales bacterium]
MRREPALSGSNEPGLRERLRQPFAVAATIGALSLAGAAGSANKTAALEGFGYADTDIMLTEPEAAQKAVDRDIQAGANTILITQPITIGEDVFDRDPSRLCMAVNLADKNDFRIVIRNEGHFENGEFGMVPITDEEREHYVKAEANMVSTIKKCAPGLKTVYISPINEPNYVLFNKRQYDARGNWTAPRDVALTYSYIYPRLHAAAEQTGIDAEIIGGDLDQHSQELFFKRTEQFLKLGLISTKLFDIYAAHFYVQKVSPQVITLAQNNIDYITNMVKTVYGNVPIWYTELGGISTVPAAKANLYTKLPKSIVPMSEGLQGQFYIEFDNYAACLGVEDVIVWHSKDDGGPMRTALTRPDDSRKRGYEPVVAAVKTNKYNCSTS